MNLKRIIPASVFGLALVFASCGKDTPPEPNTPDDGGKGEMEIMTPVESKAFLEESAKSFLNKFRTADQAEVIDLASYFVDQYGDLDIPEAFDVKPEESTKAKKTYSPASFMRALYAGVKAGAPEKIAEAVSVYTYNINFKRFVGEYTTGLRSWVKKRDSNDIVFLFKDKNGKDCELRVSAADGNSDATITVNDEWLDWDGEDYVEKKEQYVYNLSIPRTVTVTLKEDGKELANGQVKSKIDVKGHTAEANVLAKVANIEVTSLLNGTDTKVTASATLKVSGETLITTTAELNGNNLCNIDKIQTELENEDADEDTLLSFIHDGVANIDVMGNVQVYGKGNLNREVINAINADGYYWGDYSDITKSQAEENCNKGVKAMNDNFEVLMKYKGKSTTQANITFKKVEDSWGINSGEYYIEPLLRFVSDNTTYSFEDYFGTGFSSVEDLWNSIVKSYEKLWERD